MDNRSEMSKAIGDRERLKWIDKMVADAWLEAQRLMRADKQADQFLAYRDDPCGFVSNVLHEYYTEDQKRVMLSVRDNMITIARSATEVGKSQPVFTKVLTPSGYKAIGDIGVGDFVIARNGTPTQVTHIFPQGLQPTYRITFSDDSDILCSRDHLWIAMSSTGKYRNYGWQFFTTDSLKDIVYRKMHVPICEPVQYNTKIYYIHPYIMGALIGDGCLSHEMVAFTSADDWIVKRIDSLLPQELWVKSWKSNMAFAVGGKKGYANPIKSELIKLGLMYTRSNNKFIPEEYMMGDVEQRKELLAGLMDTDGYITPKGSMIYTTTSQQLSTQFVELINSLGGTAHIRTKKSFYKNKNGKRIKGQLAYNIYIKIPFNPFSLPRKSKRYNIGTIRKQPYRIIRSIEYVGEFDSVCIRVDSPEQLYLTEHCIVTHNSFIAARLAIWFYRVFADSKVYLTAANPIENLKKILWAEIMSCVDKHAALFLDDRISKDTIRRNPESFLTYLTIPTTGTVEVREAKFSGRHAPHILFIVDEGDAVPDEIYRGIEGCLSGGLMPRLLIMFNPRIQQGIVYDKEVNRQANIVHLSAMSHPNVTTGRPIIPGAVTRDSVVRRINEWTRPLMEGETETPGVFDVPDFLVDTTAEAYDGTFYQPLPAGKRVVNEDGRSFYYMVLGEYPPMGESQLISKDWIDAARTRYDNYVALVGETPPAEVKPIMGLDICEMGTDWNVACFRYGGFVPPIIAWQGLDPDATADIGLKLYKERNVDLAMVDGMGVGSSVAPAMARRGKDVDCRAVSVKVSERPLPFIKTERGEFFSIRDQLWWACREWLRTSATAMLPPDRLLTEELMAASYKERLDGRIKVTDKDTLRERLKRSPDRADALCLTFYPVRRAKVVTVKLSGRFNR